MGRAGYSDQGIVPRRVAQANATADTVPPNPPPKAMTNSIGSDTNW